MEQEQNPSGIVESLEDEEVGINLPFKVVLYNDDQHTFEEVIAQLIKAIECSFEKARDYTFEVHVKGKAIVFNGDITKCLRVSSILQEIELHTEIIS